MLRRIAALVAVFLTATFAHGAPKADFPKEVVVKGKQATALALLPGTGGSGSAFCIDKAGFFITNEHVVHALTADQKLTLVLNSGEDDEKVVEASVVRKDAAKDLALLRVEGIKDVQALELGDIAGLSETMPVCAFGYPFGRYLASKEKKYPSISVNVGRITALRKVKKKLDAIQLDAQLNGGNSGGPVLDTEGRVIGIVKSGIRGAGVNFAIPVSELNDLLNTPEIDFVPPTVTTKEQGQPARFAVRLVSFAKTKPAYTVEITLGGGPINRKLSAKLDGKDTYTLTAVLVPASKGPKVLPLNIVYTMGRIKCNTADFALKVGKDTVRMSQVKEIRPGPKTVVVLADGREITAQETDLGSIQADFGGYTATVDLKKAVKVVVEYVEEVIDKVEYTIAVKLDGRVVAERKGSIAITGQPSGGRTVVKTDPIKPPQLKSDKTEYQLPAIIEDVAVGAGGRYVILYLKRLNKLAIFDVSAAKVVQYLQAPTASFLLTASADKVIAVLPGKKLMERWSLQTFEKEASVPLAVDFQIARIAVGNNSAGPLFLWEETNGGKGALFDLATMKKTTVNGGGIPGGGPPYVVHVEAAPDGSAFTFWNRRQHNVNPPIFNMVRLNGTSISRYQAQSTMSPCHASMDGGPVFTCDGHVYTAELKPIAADGLRVGVLLPIGNSYVLAARWEGKEKSCRIAIHFMNDLKEAFSIPDVQELDGLDTSATDPTNFSYDRRIQFVPSANVLLTIPSSNDRIVIRKIDVEAALKQSKVDYLFVTSVPVRQAVRGKDYSYPIEVKAKSAVVEYSLESGPEGMKLSRTGKLTWHVPGDYGEAETTVIVAISTPSGKKIFHSFIVKLQ